MKDENLLAAVLSFVCPGAGQMVKGELGRGLAIMLAFLFSLGLSFALVITVIGIFLAPFPPIAVVAFAVYDAVQEDDE